MRLKYLLLSLLFFIAMTGLFAQATPNIDNLITEGPSLGFGLGLGTLVLENPKSGELENWNNIRMQPEFTIGKFGVGLDINVNFAMQNEDGVPGFRIRAADWIPEGDRTILDIYLPLFKYIRYGFKGDPFYISFGNINNFNLGNSFIASNYSNTRFLPEQRIAGLALDFDGALFSFPYLGIETIVGNISAFDVIGGRFYIRPLNWLEVPAIQNLQIGFTTVLDRDPFYFERRAMQSNYSEFFNNSEAVIVYGGDLRLPLFENDIIRLAIFGDVVVQNENLGGMTGFGGKLFNIVSFGGQIRFLGQNFIPNYFDNNYDLYRAQRWEVYNAGKDTVRVPAYTGWLAQLGVNVFDNQLVFDAILEGSFSDNTAIKELRPTLTANFHIDPELLGGFTFGASYQKKYIRNLEDLILPDDAIVSATIGYETSGISIDLIYDVKYDSTPRPGNVDGDDNPQYWNVNTRIETGFSF